MRALWPITDRVQAEYEALRALALAEADLCGPTAVRFARQGLAGLIAWRRTQPCFSVALVGAERPPWTPYGDPRLDALAAVYQFVLELRPQQRGAVRMA
jgi:hypothetical protein